MALVKDTAIVLRRLDYSETSQILVMLTRERGQQRLIAKGIKRSTKDRVAVGIDLLELGQVVFSQRPGKEDNLATLTEWRQEDHFACLRHDLTRCYSAQYAAEVTSHLTEVHDPHPALFDGFLRFLKSLKDERSLGALAAYLWLMLTEIGLRPELTRCVACGRSVTESETLYFSSREGGVICRDCEPTLVEKRCVPDGVVRAIVDPSRPDEALNLQVFDLLDYHLTEIMTQRPRLSAMLREAIERGV